jgi:hypothetical protein
MEAQTMMTEKAMEQPCRPMRVEALAEWTTDPVADARIPTRPIGPAAMDWLKLVGPCITTPLVGTPICGMPGEVWLEPVCSLDAIASALDVSERQVRRLISAKVLSVVPDGYRIATSLSEIWHCIPNRCIGR